VKFRGVISLRKLLPICAMPKGIFTRVLSTTFLKLTKIPWAVSGRRNTASSSPPKAPTIVLNIRLNSRGWVSVPSCFVSGPSTSAKSSMVVSETSGPFHVNRSAFFARRLKNFMALFCVSSRASCPVTAVATKTRRLSHSAQRPWTWS